MFFALSLIANCEIVPKRDTDWWAAFKYPNGINFDYADATQPQLVKRADTLDSEDAPLRKLLENFFAAKKKSGTGWIVWNDEPADGADVDSDEDPMDLSSASTGSTCKRAHAKGVLYFDKNEGHLLIHSVPKFPNLGEFYEGFITRGKIYGQSMLYLHLSAAGVREASKHIHVAWPIMQDRGCDHDLAAIYPLAFELATNKTTTRDHIHTFYVSTIETTGSEHILAVTKPCEEQDSIFEYIAEETLHSPILVESWIRSDRVPPTKYVHMAKIVRGSDGSEFQSTKDHSKYFANMDGKASGIGDLNRMKSQWVRGGSFYILTNNTEFSLSVENRILSYTDSKEFEEMV